MYHQFYATSRDKLSDLGPEYLPGPSDEEESSDSDASDGEYDVSDDDYPYSNDIPH